jgi:hypothetical protein
MILDGVKLTNTLKNLQEFFKYTGWTKSEFARRMNILPQNINKYLIGELDVQGIAINLLKEGCNLQWLFENSGNMLADNAAGWKLHFLHNPEDLLTAIERINYFIIIHYGSISKLEAKYNFDKGYISKILNDKDITDSFFIVLMNIIGCNMHWVWSGEGIIYHDNQIGEQLKQKHSEKQPSEDIDYEPIWYKKVQAIDERMERMENLIKSFLPGIQGNIKDEK